MLPFMLVERYWKQTEPVPVVWPVVECVQVQCLLVEPEEVVASSSIEKQDTSELSMSGLFMGMNSQPKAHLLV